MVTRKADKVKSDAAYDAKEKEYKLEFAKIAPEQGIFDGLQKKLVTEKIAWQWATLAEKNAKDTKAKFDPLVAAATTALNKSNPGAAKDLAKK